MTPTDNDRPTIAQLLARIEELESRAQHRRRGLLPGRRQLAVLLSATLVLATAGNVFASIPDAGGIIHGCV